LGIGVRRQRLGFAEGFLRSVEPGDSGRQSRSMPFPPVRQRGNDFGLPVPVRQALADVRDAADAWRLGLPKAWCWPSSASPWTSSWPEPATPPTTATCSS